ncbi:MAG TPA: glycosyltransferase [Chitinophagaceae bacterium]|jgi:glycosyltransferase involved in cell wall biosynthesis|nr:glycosyltransferase [Chitinophagaceae bacterium]
MKIFHLIFSLNIGGAELMLVDIINQQCRSNDVTLVVINDSMDPSVIRMIDKRIRVHYLRRKPGNRFDIRFLVRLWSLLLREKPAVLHCHNHNMIGLLPFWKHKACLTVHDVGIPVQENGTVVGTRFATENISRYGQVFAISRSVQAALREKGGIESQIVYNGVDLDAFRKREEYEALDGPFRLVQVSRLVHNIKGQDLLLKAVHELVHRRGVTGLTVDFVGGGPSEGYLKDLARELNLEGQVQFVSSKNKQWIQENLAGYHVLVQPSYFEGFGLTVVEGIVAGLPVIASAENGPAEVLEGVPLGFLFPTGDAGALASNIQQVMDLYSGGRVKALEEASSGLIAQRFSIRRTAEAYVRQYGNMIGKPVRPARVRRHQQAVGSEE